ncbi:hypothetical protein [Streptomyces sp. LaBMicrA B280]
MSWEALLDRVEDQLEEDQMEEDQREKDDRDGGIISAGSLSLHIC